MWVLLAATDARPVAGVVSLLRPLTTLLRPLDRVRRTRLPVAQQGFGQQGYGQQGYEQRGYGEQGYEDQGYAHALPTGWTAGIDEASGATYYYDEQTGQSQPVLTRASPLYCAYGLRVPASRVLHVPEAQGGLSPGSHALYVRGGSLGTPCM